MAMNSKNTYATIFEHKSILIDFVSHPYHRLIKTNQSSSESVNLNVNGFLVEVSSG